MSVTIGYEDFSRTLSYNDEGQISRSEGLLQKKTKPASVTSNTLHSFVFFQHPCYGIIFDYEGIDGLSKNRRWTSTLLKAQAYRRSAEMVMISIAISPHRKSNRPVT